MNVEDFYRAYATQYGLSIVDATAECKSVLTLLGKFLDAMKPEDRLSFYGFGSFLKKHVPSHTTSRIQDGKPVEVKGYDMVVFAQSKRGQRNEVDDS